MLDALLPIPEEEAASSAKEDGKGPSLGLGSPVLEAYFLVAVYWSLGAALIEESRTKFDAYMKKLSGLHEVPGVNDVAAAGEIPAHYPTLYEYYFDPQDHKWVPWSAKVPEYEHQPAIKFSEILVPTVDTVRNTWLLQLMVGIRHPVVLVGETGTSKTATTQNFLRNLDTDTTVSRHSNGCVA